jgi:hypothetical protein
LDQSSITVEDSSTFLKARAKDDINLINLWRKVVDLFNYFSLSKDCNTLLYNIRLYSPGYNIPKEILYIDFAMTFI